MTNGGKSSLSHISSATALRALGVGVGGGVKDADTETGESCGPHDLPPQALETWAFLLALLLQ